MEENTGYEAEAKERWGDTDAYKQSAARIKKYTTADFAAAKADQQAAVQLFIDAKKSNLSTTSPEAFAAAEAHRFAITKWFYDCSHEMQKHLAQMYLADPRFTENYESQEQGLAQYVHDAIIQNADRKNS